MKPKKSFSWAYLLIGACLALGLASCGGGGGGGSDDNGGGLTGWVEINPYYSINQDGTHVSLSGTAFVSPDFVAHRCAGLACLLGWYDDSYPGVNVSWWNRADDSTGNAGSRYGTLTDWDHVWHAEVPLVYGPDITSNLIVITATDWDGVSGVDSVTIQLPPQP